MFLMLITSLLGSLRSPHLRLLLLLLFLRHVLLLNLQIVLVVLVLRLNKPRRALIGGWNSDFLLSFGSRIFVVVVVVFFVLLSEPVPASAVRYDF